MKILVTDGLAEEAVKFLQENGHQVDLNEVDAAGLLDVIGDYEAVIVRSRTKVVREAIEKGEKLKVIGRAGIGTDNIDKETAKARGIPVVNAPMGSTVSVAELALGLMLAVSRHIARGDAGLKEGKWLKKQLKGTELYGKTLGLVGSGRIGSEVIRRARAFGMEAIAYDPYLPREAAARYGFTLVDTLDDVLARSDYLSIHALLTDETRGMIGAAQLAKMKPTAILINCARGPIVDEGALAEALKSGTIAGAGLDVYEKEPLENSPLTELDNVVLMPHIGASTVEGQTRAGTITAEQVHKVLSGVEPDFRVV
jgi:D-3-phosphoglycerate dehydrogenase